MIQSYRWLRQVRVHNNLSETGYEKIDLIKYDDSIQLYSKQLSVKGESDTFSLAHWCCSFHSACSWTWECKAQQSTLNWGVLSMPHLRSVKAVFPPILYSLIALIIRNLVLISRHSSFMSSLHCLCLCQPYLVDEIVLKIGPEAGTGNPLWCRKLS